MSAYRISIRYAKSLIDLAQEKNQLEQVYEDFSTIKTAVTQNRDFEMMLKSPVIKADVKHKVIAKVFGGKVCEMTQKFLDLLVSKGRESYLAEVANAFVAQYNDIKKITHVKFITPVAVDKSVIEKLNADLKNDKTVGNIELESVVDESLLGGFVLEYNNKQYDASVATKLADLKRKIVDLSYVNRVVKS